MHKHSPFLYTLPLLALLLLLSPHHSQAEGTVGSDCTPQPIWSGSITPPTGLTRLDINYPSSLTVQWDLKASADSTAQVSVSGCSVSDLSTAALKGTLVEGVDSVTFTLGSSPELSVPAHSASVRLVSSPLVFLALFLSCAFGLPAEKKKERASMLMILFAVVGGSLVAYGSDTSSSGGKLVISVSIPAGITQVCLNGVCYTWDGKTLSSSPSSPSSTPAPTVISTTPCPSFSPFASTTSTDVPTTTSAPTTTTAPTYVASVRFNLRVLILAAKAVSAYTSSSDGVLGGDFAAFAFDTVGQLYDYVITTSTTDLSSYLSTTGTGQYSGIVTVGDSLLSATQKSLVLAYQAKYGVKWAIVGSSPAGLPGVTAGTAIKTTLFSLSLAPSYAAEVPVLQPTISINNTYAQLYSAYVGKYASLTPATITDSTTVTPVMMATVGSSAPVVAAAIFHIEGSIQLHYFVDNSAQWIFSMAFHPILIDFLSPAGLFIGARRMTLNVQPDDLFSASYLWDTTTHTNPVLSTSPTYRMSATDLQTLADFFDTLNPQLPSGSYVTVEWPVNFGERNNWVLAGAHDDLWDKAVEIQSKFYYLSHTFTHPCDFDTGSYQEMHGEVGNNTAALPSFFTADNMNLWSPNSMVTPCLTGLRNGPVLNAMYDQGVKGCVYDESVTKTTDPDYIPQTPYHGFLSTVAHNGFAGVYMVPRLTLDIDYCATNPAMVTDEYNTDNKDKVRNFEEVMAIETLWAIQQKVGFRQDPVMLHQANGMAFTYNDPFYGGASRTVSLISLWMERTIKEMMSYFTLPVTTPQMDTIINIFKQRDDMAACGISTSVGVDLGGRVVDVSVTSTQSCVMSLSGVMLSGSTVTTEESGTETTSWISLTAGQTQTFSMPTPVPM